MNILLTAEKQYERNAAVFGYRNSTRILLEAHANRIAITAQQTPSDSGLLFQRANRVRPSIVNNYHTLPYISVCRRRPRAVRDIRISTERDVRRPLTVHRRGAHG